MSETSLDLFENKSLRKVTAKNIPKCVIFKVTPTDNFTDPAEVTFHLCAFACVENEKFCSKHMSMNQFTLNQLPLVRQCKGCHRHFLLQGTNKSCQSCRAEQKEKTQKISTTEIKCSFADPLRPDYSCRCKAINNIYCKTHIELTKNVDLDAVCQRIAYGCNNLRLNDSELCQSCQIENDEFHQKYPLIEPNTLSACNKCHRNYLLYMTKTPSTKCMSCFKVQQYQEANRTRNQQ